MISLRQIAIAAALFVGVLMNGCAERPMSVPASARLMSEGQGTIAFRPTEHGRVYIADQHQDKIIYHAEVNRDEMVELDARADKIRVAGRTVSEVMLDDGHNYRIFFEPTITNERLIRYRSVEEIERR